jgi:hypothetical protein
MTRPGPSRRVTFGGIAASVFGACGLAIVVPLLTLLGPSATFFTAHGAGRWEVVVFTTVLAFLPVAVILAATALTRRLAPRLVHPLTDVLVGLLLAVWVVSMIDRALGLGTWTYALLLLLASSACALLHASRPHVRRLVRITGFAPVAVMVWFLFFSSVSGLVLPAKVLGDVRAKRDANLLLVVFDELPLASLLNGDGRIDADRYPSFGELAGGSTWYRRATTVSPWTHLSVPAIFSGLMPNQDATSDHYARNVFSMLEPTHDLVPMELVTQLCRSETCGVRSDVGGLLDDTFVIYSHSVLPDELASRWLPEVRDRWANFREDAYGGPVLKARRTAEDRDQATRAATLVRNIRRQDHERPTAWVAHMRAPHLPLNFLPDGTVYDAEIPGLERAANWITDLPVREVARQRFVLQVRYVDMVLGRLLDALEETGRYDDTLIVITSDHGITFAPGHRRGVPYDADTAADVLPVPLFVKYPRQTKGAVDDRHAQIYDIAPTIAEALDVSLPQHWTFDGRSLLSAGPLPRRETRYIEGRNSVKQPLTIDPSPAAARYLELFGDHREHDTYAWGPHWDLVGTAVPKTGSVTGDTTARIIQPQSLHYDPFAAPAPAAVELAFDDPPSTSWVAISLNGRIAGVGPTYRTDGDRVMVMVDLGFMRPGPNTLNAFGVRPDGTLTRIRLTD